MGNTETLENLGVLDWEFDDLFDLTNLLVQSSHHFVCRIWHFLDLEHDQNLH